MNTDTHPDVEPAWGSPATEPAHWSRNKTLAAVGIAVVLAGGGAAVIHAAGSQSGQAGPGGGANWGPPGGPGGGAPGGPAGSTDALHGVFVVSDGHGGFSTELTQTGTVTEISDTSVSARSEDGFTQTYVITTDTKMGRQQVQSGETATIRAVDKNGTHTATVISAKR